MIWGDFAKTTVEDDASVRRHFISCIRAKADEMNLEPVKIVWARKADAGSEWHYDVSVLLESSRLHFSPLDIAEMLEFELVEVVTLPPSMVEKRAGGLVNWLWRLCGR